MHEKLQLPPVHMEYMLTPLNMAVKLGSRGHYAAEPSMRVLPQLTTVGYCALEHLIISSSIHVVLDRPQTHL